MNCIAIDDDLSALRIIKEYCLKIQFVNLAGTFSNPFEAVHTINNNQVDLIFLDIVMPQITGPEFLKTLYNPPMVIFTTAFREYAAEGFECDAVDYLVKPISFERLSKAVNKAFRLIKVKNPSAIPGEETPGIPLGFLMVKVEYTTIRVNLNDILYIEGLKDYVKIYAEGRLILTKTTMKNIIEKLPSGFFFRVHKSYIISVDKIDMIENSRIVIGNQRIPIGESYRTPFFEMVNRNLI
ncbi:MAG: response regulator transcription factor [Bacteroidia bacterium]|nr:MAG: response regulator transcription factor [Bacteroidia bacterium]